MSKVLELLMHQLLGELGVVVRMRDILTPQHIRDWFDEFLVPFHQSLHAEANHVHPTASVAPQPLLPEEKETK